MNDSAVILLRATRCNSSNEEKFNRWYDEVHVPLLLKFPGLRSVSRLRMLGDDEGYPGYLAIYTFADKEAFEAYGRSPEKAAADKERTETWGENVYETTWRAAYEWLRSWGEETPLKACEG